MLDAELPLNWGCMRYRESCPQIVTEGDGLRRARHAYPLTTKIQGGW